MKAINNKFKFFLKSRLTLLFLLLLFCDTTNQILLKIIANNAGEISLNKPFYYVAQIIHNPYIWFVVILLGFAFMAWISILNLIDILIKFSNYSPRIDFKLNIPSMIPVRKINIDKAKRELGFKPHVNFEVGVEKTLKWYENLIKKENNS